MAGLNTMGQAAAPAFRGDIGHIQRALRPLLDERGAALKGEQLLGFAAGPLWVDAEQLPGLDALDGGLDGGDVRLVPVDGESMDRAQNQPENFFSKSSRLDMKQKSQWERRTTRRTGSVQFI